MATPPPREIRLVVDIPRNLRVSVDEIRTKRLRRGVRATVKEIVAEALDMLATREARTP